ncbi:hypothetical protein R1flu_002147 [Riccia fluitans]|uniref:Pectinesterase inhibitor domain-containing protein n=1 Tax=Riccia fluitans TaxID=41844 RepID=A0ABD1Y599_9MARC
MASGQTPDALKCYGKLHAPNGSSENVLPANNCIPIMSKGSQQKSSSRRRLLTIGFLCLLLVGIVCSAIAIPLSMKNNNASKLGTPGSNNGPGTLATVCNATLYPELCEQSLQNENDTTTDSTALVQKSVKVASYRVTDMQTTVTNLSSSETNSTILAALRDCQEVLDDTLELLNGTLQEMSSLNLTFLQQPEQLDTLLTLMSAALTDHTTCLDGFEEVANGTVKDKLIEHGVSVDQLLSNALALVSGLAAAGDDLNKWKDFLHGRGLRESQAGPGGHRYGASGVPKWMSMKTRRFLSSSPYKVDVVVALDGSGKYKSIQKAIDDAPEKSDKLYVIYIKKGTYSGQFIVPKKKTNLVLLGDGIGKTILTGKLNVKMEGITTFLSATLIVKAPGFIGKDFTVRNTAGPEKEQAVAMRVSADKAVFWRCSFEAYQDTLYAHSLRQFYYDCTVKGTVDFMFGNGAAVFQKCKLLARLPMQGQQITFTAQGRTDPNQNTGLIFHSCILDGDKDFLASGFSVRSYMGRPWKLYSRTVFLKSYLGKLIDPEGWLIWVGDWALKTCYYAEYQSWGPGSSAKERVSWSRQITSADATRQFSPSKFIGANSWLPATKVPASSTIYY